MGTETHIEEEEHRTVGGAHTGSGAHQETLWLKAPENRQKKAQGAKEQKPLSD